MFLSLVVLFSLISYGGISNFKIDNYVGKFIYSDIMDGFVGIIVFLIFLNFIANIHDRYDLLKAYMNKTRTQKSIWYVLKALIYKYIFQVVSLNSVYLFIEIFKITVNANLSEWNAINSILAGVFLTIAIVVAAYAIREFRENFKFYRELIREKTISRMSKKI